MIAKLAAFLVICFLAVFALANVEWAIAIAIGVALSIVLDLLPKRGDCKTSS